MKATKTTKAPRNKNKNQAPPGFAFCNPNKQDAKTTYMAEQGEKIQDLFSMNKLIESKAMPEVVLQQLITENKNGFFVTDLKQLQELISQLLQQIEQGSTVEIPYVKQIISLAVVPFRKLSNGDDRRCFEHIGGFFASLCPVLKLKYQDLQTEAAKAIYWFAKNCGPLTTSEDSTFRSFYPITDDNALYSLIPQQLHVNEVISVFCDTLTDFLKEVTNDPNNTDILTLCFNSLFEFVKRGQACHIPPSFLPTLFNFIIENSEFKIFANKQATQPPPTKTSKFAITEPTDSEKRRQELPVCTTRVLAYALMFIDAYIQESEEAMKICISSLQTLWNFFVEIFFVCFKNVQKCIRNEILGIIIMTVHHCEKNSIDKSLSTKMLELLQLISMLPLDNHAKVTYKETKTVRLTHEPVDIELLLLSEDLLLALHDTQDVCISDPYKFLFFQLDVLRGNVNKYLVPSKEEFTRLALQLIRAFVLEHPKVDNDEDPLIKTHERFTKECYEVIMSLINDQSLNETLLFYTLLLALKLLGYFGNFKTVDLVHSLMNLPQEKVKILSLSLSMLAVLMFENEELTNVFVQLDGIDLLKKCFTSPSPEVVTASVDCARSIAPFCFTQIDQRFVFMLLDCADEAPTLLRYDFVGLFLDLLKYESFTSAALLWRSLKTNANIQRTIVRWWRQEEDRLDIKYDKCIIIDTDKPLDGHPLITHEKLTPTEPDIQWLLDKNSLLPPSKTYKLDFRARLYIMLMAFPPLDPADCKPTDRIKELMIRSYRELKKGSVWSAIKEQLAEENVKPLHDDKVDIEHKLQDMRDLALNIQEQQCAIYQQYEDDLLAMEKRTYNQLADGLKTAQYVAENYKAIVNSQPVTVSRSFQGRTVKGEDVLVATGNLRNLAKQEVNLSDQNDQESVNQQREKEMEESYINDCLKDESISYLVQLMKNSQSATQTMNLNKTSEVPSQTPTPNIQEPTQENGSNA